MLKGGHVVEMDAGKLRHLLFGVQLCHSWVTFFDFMGT